MAYFTDPMGDEFRKALEQAMNEMEKESEKKKRNIRSGNRKRKDRNMKAKTTTSRVHSSGTEIKRFSKKTREESR